MGFSRKFLYPLLRISDIQGGRYKKYPLISRRLLENIGGYPKGGPKISTNIQGEGLYIKISTDIQGSRWLKKRISSTGGYGFFLEKPIFWYLKNFFDWIKMLFFPIQNSQYIHLHSIDPNQKLDTSNMRNFNLFKSWKE